MHKRNGRVSAVAWWWAQMVRLNATVAFLLLRGGGLGWSNASVERCQVAGGLLIHAFTEAKLAVKRLVCDVQPGVVQSARFSRPLLARVPLLLLVQQ